MKTNAASKKTRITFTLLVVFAIYLRAATWDNTVSTGYPGSVPTDIVQIPSAHWNLLFVASYPAAVCWWDAGDWFTASDNDISSVSGLCLAQSGYYVYTYGNATFSDSSTHWGLFRWDYKNEYWQQIGSDLEIGSVKALAIGADNYAYLGFASSVTLPGGQVANGVARCNLANGNWDNMLGGVSLTTSTQTGVYSLESDADIVQANGANYTRTIIYIGGQFVKVLGSETNHNVVVWESSAITSAQYRSVVNADACDVQYGVVGHGYDCNLGWLKLDNGVFVRELTKAPDGNVLMGGWFENRSTNVSGLCVDPSSPIQTADYRGLAKMTRSTGALPGNTYTTGRWGVLDNWLDSVPAWEAEVASISFGGTNRFVAGAFNYWYPVGPSSPKSIGGRFALGSATGTGTYLYDPATYYPDSEAKITAMSRTTSSTRPIYIGGDFTYMGGIESPYIIEYRP